MTTTDTDADSGPNFDRLRALFAPFGRGDSGTNPDGGPPSSNWAPTRLSTAVVVLGTLAVVGLLTAALGVWTGVVVAAAGAVCFSTALWLLTWERWQVAATVAATLLLVPAGVATTVGVGYVLLVEFAASFPAPTSAHVVGQTLRIVSVLMVVVGTTLAVVGASASVRNVASRETVSKCFRLVRRMALVPIGFAVAFVVYALVTNFGFGPVGGVGAVADGVVTTVSGWLFAPEATTPRLLSFWLLASGATYAVFRAVRALPLAELAADETVGDVDAEAVYERVERGLSGLVIVAMLGLPVAFLVHFALPDLTTRAVLPPAAFDALVAVTTATGLRRALVWFAVGGGGIVVVVGAVRASVRTPTRKLLVGYAPFLVGMGLVTGVLALHAPVWRGLLGFVVARLSPPLSGNVQRLASSVAEFYGAHTVVLGLTAGVVFLAATAIAALWLAFALGFVRDRVAGPSLAAAGLFVATAFAGTLDAPLAVVLGGLVGSLVVWDAGEFGVTLGSEIGRRAPSRRVELLHVVGAVAVGALGSLAVVGFLRVAPSSVGGATTELSVALVGAVGAVVLLVTALR